MTQGAKVLGVDPGASGALAFLTMEGGISDIEDMPVIGGRVNASLMSNLILAYGPIRMAVIEDVHSMPKQGVTSAFKFGMSFGTVLGVLGAFQVPMTFVQPSVWKKRWGLIGQDKNVSRRRATEQWPSHSDFFKLVKHDGRAEAALIAKGWLLDNPDVRVKPKSKRLMAVEVD